MIDPCRNRRQLASHRIPILERKYCFTIERILPPPLRRALDGRHRPRTTSTTIKSPPTSRHKPKPQRQTNSQMQHRHYDDE